MPLHLREVLVGDPFEARQINQFVTAIQEVARRLGIDVITASKKGVKHQYDHDVVWRFIQNATGANLSSLAVVELTDALTISPPVFQAEVASDPIGQIAITVEPIADGSQGKAIISGHWYAGFDVTSLPAGHGGVAQNGDMFTASTVTALATYDEGGPMNCIADVSNYYTGLVANTGIIAVSFPPGRASTGALPTMIEATQNMIADDTFYNCRYITASGFPGSTFTAKRPYGIYVSNLDVGFLGQDSAGENEFIPANMREELHMPLIIENRTDDPGGPLAGRIWYRTDL